MQRAKDGKFHFRVPDHVTDPPPESQVNTYEEIVTFRRGHGDCATLSAAEKLQALGYILTDPDAKPEPSAFAKPFKLKDKRAA